MSWNNQGGGPWGGGGNNQGGPWGSGPKKPNGGNGGGGGGGPTPPDLEEMLRKSQENMKKFMPGGVGGGKLFVFGAIVLFAVWLATGFYKVESKQQGVELVFGKYTQMTLPGLHWNFPSPIGDVFVPEVTTVREVAIGTGVQTNFSRGGTGKSSEGLILTGDQNIVDVEFKVLWVINDAGKFLFNIRDPETTVRAAAQSAIREVIGQRTLDKVNTKERDQVASETMALIQQILSDYDAGISIQRVNMAKIDPPQAVIEAFNDVQAARQDKVRKQNEAEAYRNKVVPTARGEAQKLLQEAEAYKERVIKDAEGEAKRFISVYDSYAANKDVTRERLFLETMQEVLKGSDKVIMDKQGEGTGVVPYLPLGELNKRTGAK
jgi:membrane protease subunit HflK